MVGDLERWSKGEPWGMGAGGVGHLYVLEPLELKPYRILQRARKDTEECPLQEVVLELSYARSLS